jgi:hypothetical protein
LLAELILDMKSVRTLSSSKVVFSLFVGCLFSIGVLANDLQNEPMILEVLIASDSVRIGSTEYCAISTFQEAMASESRSQSVNLDVAAETRSDVLARVVQVLSDLGFEDYTISGPGYDGWLLYPPPPSVDLNGCK